MEAGLFYLFETLGQIPEHEFYKQAMEEVVLGEKLGFTGIHPAEHHFSEHYGIMPRVEHFLSWAAGKTERMKLWPMVIVAPLRNPIQLAEDVALIDNFSEGRMVFSVGSGYRKYEFKPFGQDISENTDRLREVTETCVRLWTEASVTHEGKHFAFNDARLQPKPFTKPHPPVYVTTTRDDQIKWAAEQGYGVVPAAGFNPSALKHDYDAHTAYAVEAGQPPMQTKPFFKWIYVDDDHKRGVEEGSRYILATLMAFAQGGGNLFKLLMGKSLQTWAGDVEKPEWLTDRVDQVMASGITYEQMHESGWMPYVCGSPAHVREVLAECGEAGGNYFMGGFKCGPMPQEKVKRSMRLFAEEVLPHL